MSIKPGREIRMVVEVKGEAHITISQVIANGFFEFERTNH